MRLTNAMRQAYVRAAKTRKQLAEETSSAGRSAPVVPTAGVVDLFRKAGWK